MTSFLITGGASGLGRSITEKLAQNKDNMVYITFFKSKESSVKLEQTYPNVKGIFCDFTDFGSYEELGSKVSEMEIDVLVNNATSEFNRNHFHKISYEDFSLGFNSNILPIITLTSSILKYFRKKKSGRIITILSSVLVEKPIIGWSMYTAEKAYLHSLVKTWAVENASFNITSNAISPSLMKTGLTSTFDERVIEQLESVHPLKSLLTTDEVAEAVDFLAFCSRQINGSNLIINAATDVI